MATEVSEINRRRLNTEFRNGYLFHTSSQHEVLSTWREVRKIGSGGFGSVWLEKESGGELRAVKRIPRDSPIDPKREILAMMRLEDHDDLFVRFLGWYENTNDIFVAMEYIEHGDLSDYIKDTAKAREGAKEITRQILQGLQVLHGEGICHRDLKPQNVLIASLNPIHVKIADFGASKRAFKTTLKGTALRTNVGTAGYKAPEMLGFGDGSGEYTTALDMWALGCLVHEMLTNQVPFMEKLDPELWEDEEEAPDDLQVDGGALGNYCSEVIPFPSDDLEQAKASELAIDFVKSLMAASPGERPKAEKALKDPWLAGWKNDWYDRLESEFASLGVNLGLGDEEKGLLIKNARGTDIVRFLPSGEKQFPILLQQAVEKGCNLVVEMLLKSPWAKSMNSRDRTRYFRQAVKNRGVEAVKLLLAGDCGADVNGLFGGETALQGVAERGDVEMGKVLLEQHANPNAATRDGRTPLVAAAAGGDIDLVTLLLGCGASVSAEGGPPNRRRTPVQAAAEGGHLDLVKLFWISKADLSAKASQHSGRTAVQAAAGGGHTEVVSFLLANGADVNDEAAEQDGRTTLQAACEGGHLDTALLLIANGADVNAPGGTQAGQTALQVTCGRGHTALLRMLLDYGADMLEGGKAALDGAARSGNLETVELLLQNGANLKPDRRTLQAAAWGGNIDIVKLFLDSVNTEDQDDSENAWTPLQAAAGGGHIDVVKILLEKGYDSGLKEVNHGRTALQAAAEGGYIDVVKLLLDGDPYPIMAIEAFPYNVNGRTALQAAAENGHLDMVHLLLDHGAQVDGLAAMVGGCNTLHAAAQGGHIDIVRLLIERGANVNREDGSGRSSSPLQAAVEGGNIDIVQLLLDHGANINAPAGFETGRTALQAAVENEDLHLVKLLLEKNAEVNVLPNRTGMTILEAAVRGGNSNPDEYLDMITLLLDSGANVNLTSFSDGCPTAIYAAVEEGRIGVVKLLLDKGAELRWRANHGGGRNALECAAACGYTEILKILLDHDAQLKDDMLRAMPFPTAPPPLYLAAEGGHIETVRMLLDRQVDINATSSENTGGPTALTAAARGGHTELVKLLLDNRADINAQGIYDGRTPLVEAAANGHIDVVNALLNSRVDVNAPALGSGGRTALQAAAEGGFREIVGLLLSNNANINEEAGISDRRTALQAAAGSGEIEIVKLLLERGADVNAKPGDIRGRTALQAAAENNHMEVAKLLLSRGAELNANAGVGEGRTALQAAAGAGLMRMMKFLLDSGANLNAEAGRDQGRTALQAAAENGHLDLVKLLVDAGAEVNAPPIERGGRTAVQAAAEGGHFDVVKFLLNIGADPNAAPASGYGFFPGCTALQGAMKGSRFVPGCRGYIKIVRLLLENGADDTVPFVFDDKTALEYATQTHNTEMVKVLGEHRADINATGDARKLEDVEDDGKVVDVGDGGGEEGGRPVVKVVTGAADFQAEDIVIIPGHGGDDSPLPVAETGDTPAKPIPTTDLRAEDIVIIPGNAGEESRLLVVETMNTPAKPNITADFQAEDIVIISGNGGDDSPLPAVETEDTPPKSNITAESTGSIGNDQTAFQGASETKPPLGNLIINTETTEGVAEKSTTFPAVSDVEGFPKTNINTGNSDHHRELHAVPETRISSEKQGIDATVVDNGKECGTPLLAGGETGKLPVKPAKKRRRGLKGSKKFFSHHCTIS